jgi:hypothetical protein
MKIINQNAKDREKASDYLPNTRISGGFANSLRVLNTSLKHSLTARNDLKIDGDSLLDSGKVRRVGAFLHCSFFTRKYDP